MWNILHTTHGEYQGLNTVILGYNAMKRTEYFVLLYMSVVLVEEYKV